jgi:predicted histidine transporter YuiF (NhaC family)
LSEEYSFFWIVTSAALIVLSLARHTLDAAALRLGIRYGPALLLLALIFFVMIAALHFSIVISRQRHKIDRLIEDVALLEARHRESGRDVAPREGGSPISAL